MIQQSSPLSAIYFWERPLLSLASISLPIRATSKSILLRCSSLMNEESFHKSLKLVPMLIIPFVSKKILTYLLLKEMKDNKKVPPGGAKKGYFI